MGQRESKSIDAAGKRTAVSAGLALSTILILSFVLFLSTVATAAYIWASTGSPSSPGSSPIRCLALDEIHNILYAGADTGEVYRYQSGAWSTTGGPSAPTVINDIEYDPVSNTVVAALYIDSSFQVWTFQEGGTWTLTNGAVGNQNPSSVASDGAQKKLYAGAYSGEAWVYDYQTAPGPWSSLGNPMDSVRSMEMDTTRHVLYAGGSIGAGWPPEAVVYRYDGSTWSPFGNAFGVGLYVSSLALDSTRNILYAGTWTGVTGEVNVFRRDIGTGGDWVGIGTLCGGPEIFALAVDETNNTLYALAYDGHVYKNCDASVGSTWIDIGLVSENTPINSSLQYDPGSTTLFAGSSDGQVYRQGIPAVTALNPSSGAQGHTLDIDITASNSDFTAASKAIFSGDGVNVNSTTRLSSNSVRANITIEPGTYQGPRSVWVKTGGEKTNKLVDGFKVTDGTPVISSISPESGPAGAEVTVKGTNFGELSGSSRVRFGTREAASYKSWSDSEIVAKVPSGLSGEVDVTVVTAVGTSNANKFTITLPAWYLAEGTTAWGFSTYITLENPNNSELHARLTYMDPKPASGAGVVATRTITLPPLSQTTVDPRWDLGDTDFSTKVECLEGKPIAVDRTMSWTGTGASSSEAHNSIGTDSPSMEWYLPEGSSNHNFESWTLVLNPNSTEANITLSYMTEDAGRKDVQRKIPAYSRASYSMQADIGAHDSSVKATSDVPVVAERSTYRNDRREGSCSIGATAPASDYYLAEGATGYDVGFVTYVLVQNPNENPVDVTLTYQTGSGQVAGPAFNMPANSRKTVKLNDTLLPNTDVSTKVHSSGPIVAERAMYWNSPTGEACHASIGMSSPHTTFYLPDGQSSDGRETWTLVQNPNSEDVQVDITYLKPDGFGNVTKTETIPANSRRTFIMLSHSGIADRAAIVVTCKAPGRKVIAERSMYWNSRGAGTDTIGGYED